MEWRLFLSTFALVFLAELGDKTQLASMAVSAGTKSPWAVFTGASSALVLSALIAVLVGSTLQKVIPLSYLKIGSSILFLVFGTVLLVSTLREKVEAAPPIQTEGTGIVTRIVLKAAAEFERTTSQDYRRLANEAETPRMRELFAHLAEEEEAHLAHIDRLAAGDHAAEPWPSSEQPVAPSTAPTGDASSVPMVLRLAIEHEERTAAFYRSLAESAPIPAVRTVLSRLAAEEESHVAHLREMSETGRTAIG